MAVSYRKLRYRLVDDKISLAKLMRMTGITDYAVRQISKDRDVSTEALTKICAKRIAKYRTSWTSCRTNRNRDCGYSQQRLQRI